MGSGLFWGPTGHNRAAFTLEGNAIWDAGERAENLMPPEGRDVPLFVGPKDPTDRVNVLALPVLRELVHRHDLVMADGDISKHFVSRYY